MVGPARVVVAGWAAAGCGQRLCVGHETESSSTRPAKVARGGRICAGCVRFAREMVLDGWGWLFGNAGSRGDQLRADRGAR